VYPSNFCIDFLKGISPTASWSPAKIKSLRSPLGLSQAKMADVLGVSEHYVYLLERGERTPGKHLSLFMDQVNAEPERFVPQMSLAISRKAKKK
jgi:DNA-binding transcriptional regulator YiaG